MLPQNSSYTCLTQVLHPTGGWQKYSEAERVSLACKAASSSLGETAPSENDGCWKVPEVSGAPDVLGTV